MLNQSFISLATTVVFGVSWAANRCVAGETTGPSDSPDGDTASRKRKLAEAQVAAISSAALKRLNG